MWSRHKKQSHSAVKNYRPASLLSVVFKDMEKIVNTAIINHREHEKGLPIQKYGFRQGHSTSDLLTSLNHSWVSEVNRGGAVRVLAVDIAGAFDKVSHRGVLHKAASYSITGPLLNWLSDYLYDRKLQAVVGGASSESYKIDAGVPQGSILGPTLFFLYVNDACDVLPEGIGCTCSMGCSMARHFRANEITGHDCVPPPQTLGDTTHPVQRHSGPGMLAAEAPWSDV